MDENHALLALVTQIPLVGLFWLVVRFFLKEMRDERGVSQAHSIERDRVITASFDKRDALFTAALDRNSNTIAENTEALRELDKAITIITDRNNNGIGHR